MRLVSLAAACVFLCYGAVSPCQADDWPQFRGLRGSGVSEESQVPLSWSREKNIRWRVALPAPGNNGSPIVSHGSVLIVVATDKGRRRSLHCYDRNSGRRRWIRSVAHSHEELTHRTSLYAGTTPAADGTRVVVWHSSAGMHCYDYDGKPLWSKDLGKFIHIWGYGASPIIYKDLVINNCGPGDRTFLVALDKRSGDVVWKVDEPGGRSEKDKPWVGSWSTPVVANVDGRDLILVSYPQHVKAYDPASGDVVWQCDGLGPLVYTSVVIGDGCAVAMGGYSGPAIGLTLGGTGNVTKQNLLWRVERNPQRIGTGVIRGNHMFVAGEQGIIQCLDVASGKQRWEARLPDGGRLWTSLIYAAGRLYATTQDAKTVVFAADPEKLEVLSVNPLDEHTNSTIAVSNRQIFLRTHKALYCIEGEQ